MTSLFILIQLLDTKEYKIYWKSPNIDSHNSLANLYRTENPKQNFNVLGGGKLITLLDKKTVVLFGKTSDFGQFNAELVHNIAKELFVHWTVISNPWENKLDKAIEGWDKCKFKYQLFLGHYSKAIYAIKIKSNGTIVEIPKAYPVAKQFMIIEGDNKGTTINPNEIYEIKRVSHKGSSR